MKAKIYRELICENGCSIFGLVDHSITLEEARSGRFEASEPFGSSSFLYCSQQQNQVTCEQATKIVKKI